MLQKLFIPIVFLFCRISFAGWIEIETDFKTKINSVNNFFFSSPTTGWVQGGQSIFKTENGGKNWDKISLNCTSGIPVPDKVISFADSANGWILRKDTLFHTVNGGKSWDTINLSINNFKGICFQSAKRGVAFTNTTIYFTIDSGNTWEKSIDELQMVIADIQFSDTLVGWICGPGPAMDAGSILTTRDGGKSWHYYIENSYEYQAIWAFDSMHVVAGGIGSGGKLSLINTTFDGGHSWSKTLTSNAPRDIAFLNSDYGVAVAASQDSMFLETYDGGRTWNRINEIIEVSGLFAVRSKSSLFVLTNTFKIFKYELPVSVLKTVAHVADKRNCYVKDLLVDKHNPKLRNFTKVTLNGQTISGFYPHQAPAMTIKILPDNIPK